MTNLTHPDILKMERDGYLGSEPKPVARCDYCGAEIYPGEAYYDVFGCIFHNDYDCEQDFLSTYLKVIWED